MKREVHIPDVWGGGDGVALAVTPYSLRQRTTRNFGKQSCSIYLRGGQDYHEVCRIGRKVK